MLFRSWQCNHDNRVEAARALIEREDLPIERTKFYNKHLELLGENALLKENIGAETTRLDWIESNLIERKWDGTIGRPCTFYIRGDFRHTMNKLHGYTFRDAIDMIITNENKPGINTNAKSKHTHPDQPTD